MTTPGERDRPELTTLIAADPRVPQLPQGDVITSVRGGRLWIERADPRVVISFQLLDAIVCRACAPEVTIRPREYGFTWGGAVLRIEAANRTLVYRLTECVPWYLGWIMEWPD